MAFIFSKTVTDVIRNRDLLQSLNDKRQQKKRSETAPSELPNQTIHGITPNGTHFFCNLVYQKNLPEYKKTTILHLIDAYANTEDRAEHIRLKSRIKEACGGQVEGIALLFSNADRIYGFVTGNRVKIARWRNQGPLEPDTDELFSISDDHLSAYHTFILANEEHYTPALITRYIQGDETDDNINTEVINAIKHTSMQKQPEQMSWYLKAAYPKIQNPTLRQQVKAVYDALQLLDHDDRKIKYQATVLTVQLLHSQNNEKRKQLLADYTQLASTLYGAKIPTLMIVSISMFFLVTSLLALSILTGPVIPLSLIIACSGFNMLMSLISGVIGKNEFYNDEARQKRRTATTFFNLMENLNTIPGDLIPAKIQDPCEYSMERDYKP